MSDAVRMAHAKASLLARRPTKSFSAAANTTPAHAFESLYRFVGLGEHSGREMVLQGRFHVATLGKM